MAQKKSGSQAQRVVSDTRKSTKSGNSRTAPKSQSKAADKKKPNTKASPASAKSSGNSSGTFSGVPVSILSLALAALLTVLALNPDGAVLNLLYSVVLGILGRAGFYASIFALAGVFILNTFSRSPKVKLRSICALVFALLCGCIFHLLVQTQGTASGLKLIPDLYQSGVGGYSGGVLCGGLAMAIRWGCGKWSVPLCALLAILTLLAAFDITVGDIFRAIRSRPETEEEEPPAPPPSRSQQLVDGFVKIRNDRKQKKFVHVDEVAPEVASLPQAIPEQKAPKSKKAKPLPGPEPVPAAPVNEKAARMMNTIDLDISSPVFGDAAREEEEILTGGGSMPPLKREAGNEPAPVVKPAGDVRPKGKTAPEPVEEPQEKKKVTTRDTERSARQVAAEIAEKQAQMSPEYCFPPMALLKKPVRGSADGTEEMRENSRRLNETLASFNIDAHIINVTRGPSVTRYEVELDKGVRLNKLTGCADDIALSLGASGVRIAAIPGKISVVGIEVPNRSVTTVSLRDVLDSPEFTKAKSKSSIGLGKSIDGNCVVGNIAKMPHLLIAGTTGSGKSVCMNSIIISLLYKAGPEDVKLIMVDPKMVELGIYNGIPHLLIPVVTDPKKAAGSLQWAVTEMLRRYKMMSDQGVRDLESYNSIVSTEEGGKKLPAVVIIIDELADLMMVAAKEVEDSICRIAQMGRAAGMHLIIATQRPSANVITGLMKANIPSRIAFSVASAMESRIILDTMGAEKLVGKGDMLYAPIGCGKPLRVQGCFVTDQEVEAVAGYVKENYVADYNQEVLQEIEKQAAQTGKKAAGEPEPTQEELDGDELLPAAVEVILETGQASVSMLQRRLKLGYARAARIVDEMEEKGIVGPFQGSKPRTILVTKESWAARQGGGQMALSDMEDSAVPEEIF